MAFKQLPALARSQEAYDRFSAATNLPLTLLALLWLPLLVLPLVMGLPAGVCPRVQRRRPGDLGTVRG